MNEILLINNGINIFWAIIGTTYCLILMGGYDNRICNSKN